LQESDSTRVDDFAEQNADPHKPEEQQQDGQQQPSSQEQSDPIAELNAFIKSNWSTVVVSFFVMVL
jgi:hypothetical protein